MKIPILTILSTLSLLACKVSQKPSSVSGTYELVSKTIKKDDDVYGYAGQIQVKELPHNKVVVSFFITKGAPSYNSGSFVDTLDYIDGTAFYTAKEFDPSCKITFKFSAKGVQVVEQTDDYNSGCGFGHAVVTNGFFKRVTSEVPVIKDLVTGEELN